MLLWRLVWMDPAFPNGRFQRSAPGGESIPWGAPALRREIRSGFIHLPSKIRHHPRWRSCLRSFHCRNSRSFPADGRAMGNRIRARWRRRSMLPIRARWCPAIPCAGSIGKAPPATTSSMSASSKGLRPVIGGSCSTWIRKIYGEQIGSPREEHSVVLAGSLAAQGLKAGTSGRSDGEREVNHPGRCRAAMNTNSERY